MTPTDDAIRTLREALKLSPDNLPLRRHLAESLARLGRFDEAEAELRQALAAAADDRDLALALARVYAQQGKDSHALVILEDLVGKNAADGASRVFYARLLAKEGKIADAVAQYKLGIELDPEAGDEELANRLGIVPEDEASEIFEGRIREAAWQGGSSSDREVERPKITFRDVGGMDALKEEISMKIIFPLQHPEIYEAYGKPAGGGIMMYGPPGCGKTYLARATAGEIQAGFLSVGISDVLDMWMGSSERNLHELFEQARRNRPCVLFFDEVDALGGRRSDMVSGTARQVINQFLAELDGVESSNDGVLVLAATNAPWHVDAAFRRPGRFDRVLFVPPPDAPARAAILRVHSRNKPIEDLDFDRIAAKTEAFSGADLKATIDAAVEIKLREAMKSGVPKPLSTKDLLAAAKTLQPTTREWFATARNYALYANQGGLYDEVRKYMKF